MFRPFAHYQGDPSVTVICAVDIDIGAAVNHNRVLLRPFLYFILFHQYICGIFRP